MRCARGSRILLPTRAPRGRRGWRGLHLLRGRRGPCRAQGCLGRTRPWRACTVGVVLRPLLRQTSAVITSIVETLSFPKELCGHPTPFIRARERGSCGEVVVAPGQHLGASRTRV